RGYRNATRRNPSYTNSSQNGYGPHAPRKRLTKISAGTRSANFFDGTAVGCPALSCQPWAAVPDSRSLAGKDSIHMDTKGYLRHPKTRSYYASWRCWTDDVERAENFKSPEQAMKRAREEQMNLMEVVIQDVGKETVIPVVNPASL